MPETTKQRIIVGESVMIDDIDPWSLWKAKEIMCFIQTKVAFIFEYLYNIVGANKAPDNEWLEQYVFCNGFMVNGFASCCPWKVLLVA